MDGAKLKLNKFQWYSNPTINATGFVWLDGKYIEKQEFILLLNKKIKTFEQFQTFANSLNGQYSIIIYKETETWITCSQTWSYPIFYLQNEKELQISDDPKNLKNKEITKQPDQFAELYFLNFGVTPNNSTLLSGISQVRPGELIRFQNKKPQIQSLFPIKNKPSKNQANPGKLRELLIKTFKKYYTHLENKEVLLPLTKGYDSRLIACLLKEYGHKNVICATWGRDQNTELNTAQKVAKELGYKHVFIPYTYKLIKNFSSEKTFRDYTHFAGHWSSMPYLQDYFAVKYLVEKKIINSKTVVLPGHMGDFTMGSHLKAAYKTAQPKELVSEIISNLGNTLPIKPNKKQQLTDYITSQYFSEKNQANSWKNFEAWDLEERQCKFIINSTLVFSFFNIDFLMPLFDKEIVDFSKQMSFDQKLNTVFYNHAVEQIFKNHKVDFDLKSTSIKKARFEKIKNLIISNTPRILKRWYYPISDSIFYKEITKELIQREKAFRYIHPKKPHYYNAYIIQWYLQHFQNSLKP